MTEVVDATLAPDDPGTDLVTVAPASLFRTDDPAEVVVRATQVANALTDVIERKKLYAVIQGKKHVLVEGWQLVGAMLGVTAVCVGTEPVEGGFIATVEARTSDGRVIGRADAICSKHEKRGPWKTADDYARLSMAQTRATAKALKGPLGFVVSLAGYQTTPAEEMTFAEPDPPAPAPDAAPVEPITSSRAVEIVKGATVLGLLDKLQLAATHVHGSDVGDCSTEEAAYDALRVLTMSEADRLAAWLDKKAGAPA